jgi:flagellar protein FliO/FliZ
MAIEIIRYIGALFLVLALIGAAGLAARKWGVPGVTKAVDEKRLAVIETLMVGPRQRLFIVRRDNVEHLIFASPDGVCMVENNFSSAKAVST